MSLFGPHVTIRADVLAPGVECAICSSELAMRDGHRIDLIPAYQCGRCFTFYHRTCANQWWKQYGEESTDMDGYPVVNMTGHSCPFCRAPWPAHEFTVIKFFTRIQRNGRRDHTLDCSYTAFRSQQFKRVLIAVCNRLHITRQSIDHFSLRGQTFTVGETRDRTFGDMGINQGSVLTIVMRPAPDRAADGVQ